jgi:glucose-6-phosphate 1-epimerase
MQASSSIEALNDRFSIKNLVQVVAGQGNLPKIHISSPAAEADIYLHGAHITSWRPAGSEEVIFLSKKSHWEEGRAIRGGIPVCFPWFRAKADDPHAPAHGFARIKTWQLVSITQEQDSIVVSLQTESDDESKRWWPHEFQLLHRITVGAELRSELIVTNTDSTPLRFEEALHTYYNVGDAAKVRIAGLDGVDFFDNTDANRGKTQSGDIVFARPFDNVYVNAPGAVELNDPSLQRRIHIKKENSFTTVVWNPWIEGAKAMSDLGDDEWRQMACVEASNILDSAVTLAPGEKHTMTASVKVTA